MSNKIVICKTCGKEIAAEAKSCPGCGAKNRKKVTHKNFLWIIILIFVVGAVASIGNSDAGVDSTDNSESNGNIVSQNQKTSVFDGDCGINATAQMGSDIIGQPTLTISVKNTSNKDISAIKFYALPLDVYGDEINSIYSMNYLYTDDTIKAGKSDSCSYQFLDNEVKKVELYVYSVYFSDGTEWGDKDATKSTILKNALKIEVDGISEK